MSVIEEIRMDLEGAELLADWLGEGGIPVGREKAESRSVICEACRMNRPGRIWESIKHMAALWIRKELEVRNKLGLQLPNDDKLGICNGCRCCNGLKVWTPIKHIKAHMSPEVIQKLDPSCWIKGEMNE
jgi:hypothetical protein